MGQMLFIDFGALVTLILSLVSTLGAAMAPADPGPAVTVARIEVPADVPIAAMRADLAGRLGIDEADVAFVAYRDVTWGDACLGVRQEGRVCAQSLRPGYLAIFEAGGRRYHFHGSGDRFEAASFVPAMQVSEPMPHDVAISGLSVKPLTP